MANVLFMLGAFYPEPSANGVCCDALIKYFVKKNHKVHVVCNKQIGLKNTVKKGETTIYPIPDLLYQQFAEMKRHEQSKPKQIWYSIAEKTTDYIRLFAYLPFFPICSPIRKQNFYKVARDIICHENIDIVISVCMPGDAVFATEKLKVLYPKTLFITYLLDPIAGGLKHKLYTQRHAYSLALKREKKIVKISDSVIAQLEHEAHFRKEYPQSELTKFSFLGVPLLTERLTKPKIKKDIKTVVYAGAISESNRNPHYIINVFKKVKNAKLIMYITNDPSIAIEAANQSPNIKICGRVSHDELEAILLDADAFINIGNNQKMQSPSKLIEYISYGKPIISTYRIDGDTSVDLLRNYPSRLFLDEREDQDIAAVALSIERFLVNHEETTPYYELQHRYKAFSAEAFYDAVMKNYTNNGVTQIGEAK